MRPVFRSACAAVCLVLAALPSSSPARAQQIERYDACHATGAVLLRLAGDDAAMRKQAQRQQIIFRNLAYHQRRSGGAGTASAMVETLRARSRAVKRFAELFQAANGAVPKEFAAGARGCARLYGEITSQPPPAPAHLWPKWQTAADSAYGTTCGDPVRSGGDSADGNVIESKGVGVALSYYWLSTLRDSEGNRAEARRTGSGTCPGAEHIGLVDFWTVDGHDFIVAPYAAGFPKLPKGYSAVY